MKSRITYMMLLGAWLVVGAACNPVQETSPPAELQPVAEQKQAVPAPEASSLAIFSKRILPILQSAKPSSCAECHLSGVDLKDYIHPTQQATFAALVAAEMIDVQNPGNSKILTFINRRPERSSLITDKIRQEEYEAFRAWIQAAVADPQLLAEKGAAAVGPHVPAEVVRHARKDRVLESFVDNIWTEVTRCAACHSPGQNQKQVKEHGEQVSWIKPGEPEATLSYMLEAGIINPDAPLKSLLLMKPTQQVEHGGGQKMVVGDRTYKQFRRFIDDYSASTHGKYTTADQLPSRKEEVSIISDIWLKIEGVPAKYDQKLLQADLYRQTNAGLPEHRRLATSDRPVFGKGKLWQHSLSLTAPRDSPWAKEMQSKRLPPGKYLVKLYIDQSGRLQKDFTAELGEQDFVGQIEVDSRWPVGYGKMTIVRFPAK